MFQATETDLALIEYEEGVVLKAYLDPTNTWTIGSGFTNASKIVTKHIGKIKRGVTITAEQSRQILKDALALEYAPPVERKMPGAAHHELAAGLSATFNVGERILDWKWAQAWRAGDKQRAAQLLEVTATTSKGQKLAGLVARRKREATLLLTGRYPTLPKTYANSKTPAVSRGAEVDDVLKEYQAKLKKLGFDPGLIDGRSGPQTTAAVRRFQTAHPDLVPDGIMGRATMAQIDRALDLTSAGMKKLASGTAITTSVGGIGISWPVGLAIGLGFFLIVAAFLAWKYRGEIQALVKK